MKKGTMRLKNIQKNAFLQLWTLREEGIIRFLRWNLNLVNAWIREKVYRKAYKIYDESKLRATRKSDKVFIFGSGYSINDISDREWNHFEQHDTLGFSGFVYQKKIHIDYHLIRGWVETMDGALTWRNHTIDYAEALNNNEYFRDAILIMQGEYLAQFCNSLIGYRYLRTGWKIWRYITARGEIFPTKALKSGLNHLNGTLCDVVNFAYCMGWKEIVLVGVDLYDSRYFWLNADETLDVCNETGTLIPSKRNKIGCLYDQSHNTAVNGIVETMGKWVQMFLEEEIHMSVYNPISLLADIMPVYKI